MKKLLLMLVVALTSLCASADNLYAGGSVGFWRNASDNKTDFSILPELGYNINSKVSVGASFGYQHTYNDGFKLNLGCVNPYLRYKFFQSGKVDVFVDGGVDLGFGASRYDGHSTDTAVTFGIGFKPGIAYNISDKFSLVAHVGMLGYKGGNHASGADKEGGFMLDGNNLSFGFYVNF